jgi:hypothetical protein
MGMKCKFNGLATGSLTHKDGADTTIHVLTMNDADGTLLDAAAPVYVQGLIHDNDSFTGSAVLTVDCEPVTGYTGYLTLKLKDTDDVFTRGVDYYLEIKRSDGTGEIDTLSVSTSGSGITAHPTVSISGGNEDATATVNVGVATVASITVPGSGYVVSDVLTHTDPGASSVTDATFSVSSVDGSGGVTALLITAQGSYSAITSGDVTDVTLSGGSGDGTAAVNLTYGLVSAAVTNAGSGFNDAPEVTLTNGGTGELTATITDVGRLRSDNYVTLQVR